MEQDIRIKDKEILEKLEKLQMDVNHIKEHLKLETDLSLEEEMKLWERASDEDMANWEAENLKDEKR